ncbi:putative RING finger protein [Chionoecetes opilio]|uniref:Putative RING finger protein n=1 Tax=Chionoecetes opilio TaxID=41210 RepID=A0A8J4Y6D3_CHIOP|nr:putative RING finger protein [Chionoecetes opilio]
MEELLSCSVCCEQYQEKHRHPVLLPRCGHSFCRPCVAFLVKNGCVICPSCRTDQRVETADHLPTEFSLLAITNAQQVTKLTSLTFSDLPEFPDTPS